MPQIARPNAFSDLNYKPKKCFFLKFRVSKKEQKIKITFPHSATDLNCKSLQKQSFVGFFSG